VNDVIQLSRAFASRYGVPSISQIDLRMYTLRYFTHCLACTFCHDWCCEHGVDVDLLHVRAMEQHREGLEVATGIPFADWFTDEYEEDDEVPGGASMRTNTTERGCVFLTPGGRGCTIHQYANDNGIDYHELKSLVDVLFPLTYEGELLTIADEVADGSLVCLDTGPTVYQGMRKELQYYFGDSFVKELDEIEAGELTVSPLPSAPDVQMAPGR